MRNYYISAINKETQERVIVKIFPTYSERQSWVPDEDLKLKYKSFKNQNRVIKSELQ